MPLVRIEQVTKAYGGVPVLCDVDLTVEAGEVVGLIGANGAGKSTLMNVLAGVAAPDAGTVSIDGVPLQARSPQEALELGVVLDPQELNLIGEQSIAENLLLGNMPRRGRAFVARQELDRRALELLRRVGLEHLDPALPGSRLSPVQARLVSIARALSRDPRVLILDEPSAALPTETARELGPIIARLAERGSAIVYVSHRFGEVAAFCDRAVAMRDGRIAGELSGDALQPAEMVRLVGGSAATLEAESVAAPPPDTEVVLTARGLCGSRVQDVDLTVHRGEVLGVGGLQGSGRSELLRLICGVQARTAGDLDVLGGGPPSSLRELFRRGVGYVAERRAEMTFPTMSVTSNGTIAALRRLHPFAIRRRREDDAVSGLTRSMNLVGRLGGQIRTLSGGNQQKVLLARWMLCETRLLILDEPTVGIDVVARVEIHGLLRELAEQGVTVIVASAEPEELVLLCNRAIVMAEGRVARDLVAPFDADQMVAASYAGAH